MYTHFDFDTALEVMDEMRVSVPNHKPFSLQVSPFVGTEEGRQKSLAFVGRSSLKNESLLSEALTHPSVDGMPSYQKLEWVGDAVLSLAVRNLLNKEFPTTPVGILNLFEVAIVNNETLSYLAVRSGLHSGAICYDSCELREGIDFFLKRVEKTCGLWGSSAPKCLADVTESLIGAVHLDGGWKESEGTATYIINRLVRAIKANTTVGTLKATAFSLMHPKQQM